jgi:DNA-binding SARP family transcriptional activator
MISTLNVYLLGGFRLLYGGTPLLTVNTARLQTLLAYLVLHHHTPQPRHHLAFLLWPDTTEAQALTNLRGLFHRLRHALPGADQFLHAEIQTLQWRPNASFTLDVADFENGARLSNSSGMLRQAVDLYGGDLLPHHYDEWLAPERDRLRQACVEALERLIFLLLQEQSYRDGLHYAHHLLRFDPLHETAYRYLMRLHALCGDRAEALRVFHICATVLRRELGVEPSLATRALYESLSSEELRPQVMFE